MTLSSQTRRELALAEVRAHRPGGLMELTTLQFDHPAFDFPARVVADNEPLEARIEDGTIVTFEAVEFSHVGPAQGEGRWPQVELTIDNAADLLEPHLEAALETDTPVSVTVRIFIRQLALEGPGRIIAGLELDRTRSGDLNVSGTAGFFGLDRKFGTTFDPSEYPGLG